MFKKAAAAIGLVALAFGLASAPAQASVPDWDKKADPAPSSSSLIQLPNRPAKANSGFSAQWTTDNRSHAGEGQLLSATDAANSPGLASRIQSWSVTTGVVGTECIQSLGEIWVGSADSAGVTTNDVVVGAAFQNACGYSGPRLAVEAFRNGTWLGWSNFGGSANEFTTCTSSAVAGCSLPGWKHPNDLISSNQQYELKWVYQHQGTSSEGWWLWFKGPGAIPTGYQGWLGYYRKGIWANAAAPANQGWTGASTPWRLAFGEVYDPRANGSRCVDMGNGNYPNGSGNGAIIDQLSNNVPGVSTAMNQQTLWEDPSDYGLANQTANSFRYGGTGQC
jgi:hypothetical protein